MMSKSALETRSPSGFSVSSIEGLSKMNKLVCDLFWSSAEAADVIFKRALSARRVR